MKILHWDEMFHPNFGYQINVLSKFQVKQGHEVVIMTSDKIEEHPTFAKFGNKVNIQFEDKKFSEKYGVKIIRLPIHRVISGRVIYKRGYLKRIIDEKPDIMLCHTNDTLSGINITRNYRRFNFPIVFDNHMLEMASRNSFRKIFRFFFRKFVTPIITRNNLIVIRTQDDDYVNKQLGVPSRLTPFISFGSDTTIFKPDKRIREEFRNANGINSDDFVVIYAGKLTEAKGAKLLADAIKQKFLTNREIVFIVVGNAKGQYEVEALSIMQQSENKIIHFPTQKYDNLPEFYQASDLCLFPKQCSLSFYDAQACGLPVIAEDNNINVDRLSHDNGLVYEQNNVEDLKKKIMQIANMDKDEYDRLSQNAYKFVKDSYDYKDIAEKYTKILIEEYNRFHGKEGWNK